MNETSKGVELNWAGVVIGPKEGYGGRPENIPQGCPAVLGALGDAPKKDRREVVNEDDVAAIFNNGALTKTEAAEN